MASNIDAHSDQSPGGDEGGVGESLYYLIRHIFLPPKLPYPDETCKANEQTLGTVHREANEQALDEATKRALEAARKANERALAAAREANERALLEAAREANERALLETVCDALKRFRRFLCAEQTPAVDRCIRMLSYMMDARDASSGRWSADVCGEQIGRLENDDCLVVHIRQQNAGLIITRANAEMHFESLEVLATDTATDTAIATDTATDTAIAGAGRLRRRFPDRAVAVARSSIIDPPFLQPFLRSVAELDRTQGMPRRPALANEVLMAVLRRIGRGLADEVVSISKHSREESLTEEWPPDPAEPTLRHGYTKFSWRRSPLWLLLRVALQLTLDRAAKREEQRAGRPAVSLYKAAMVFTMGCVLDKAASGHVPHDLLFFMKSKISQRIMKLASSDEGATAAAWYSFPCEVLRRVDPMLTKTWDAIQSAEETAPPLLSGLDFRQDTLLSLEALKLHLKWISQRRQAEAPHDANHSFPFRRAQLEGAPRDTFSSSSTGDMVYFELADFEKWAKVQARPREDSISGCAATATPAATFEDADAGGACCAEGKRPGFASSPPSLPGSQAGKGSGWQWHVDNVSARALRVLDADFKCFVRPAARSEHCELCKMLHAVLWPRGTQSTRPVGLYRNGTNLWADEHDRPVVHMRVAPTSENDTPITSEKDTIQVGPPKFLMRPSKAYFELLRNWLRLCDERHPSCGSSCHGGSQQSRDSLPTRVIDVGDVRSGEQQQQQQQQQQPTRLLRLVRTEDLPDPRIRYVALSHCWGRPTDAERRRNGTFKDNVEERRRGIDYDKLGKTFQDAVTVTRALGQRYLWVDSLCIVQDDDDDWKRESGRMETVFSSAYCVIAATAAGGTSVGFLRRPPTTRTVRTVVFPTPSGPPLYLCESVDDFGRDVEDAALSHRGWVLQERALARRTIHFSAGQTYFECGGGIYCESMALMKNREASVFGDPQFPKLAMEQADDDASNARHRVFQVVFKTYSQLELSRHTDRPVAIAGVQQRLAKEMGTPVAFGIFAKPEYLHRSLLWCRAGDLPLQWIHDVSPRVPSSPRVPTWSWMAYMGAIDYLKTASAQIDWNPDTSLSFKTGINTNTAELTAPVVAFKAETPPSLLPLVMDNARPANVQELKCIVTTGEQTTGELARYQRFGVGTVYGANLELKCPQGRERELPHVRGVDVKGGMADERHHTGAPAQTAVPPGP
ncbi:hypothetical protein GGTG_09013 [Gaeumannomyces tritici R3-111a-1]|uniref:Uncharacterized protein n=1 Tax=Gaeumannomyces tritici (strain R3-111a-1) TaxID=644352 RepID=J3P672_GAET3|nr:hypothetical protein GGTG_09013 [Gaeumannomyces tritici R3-111a-1]EJT72146.1 hypothetical protein GGTG_09013 [Gaeumannomyces tritici R3-111a-1]